MLDAAPSAPGVDRWMLPGELASIAGQRPGARSGRRTPRDWAVDLTAFLLAALIALAERFALAIPIFVDLPGWLLITDQLVGVVACVALWWRRRFPVVLGIFAAVAMAISNTAVGAATMLLFSLALHRGWMWAAPIGVGAMLLSAPYIYTYFPASIGPPTPWLMIILFLTALVITAGLGMRARRQLVVALRMRADDERREHQRQLEESRRAERQLIAREMHDVLAHRISLLTVHAGALEYRTAMAEQGTAAPPTAAEVHQVVSVVRANANQALEELRDVLHLLRRPSTAAGAEREDGTAAPQPDAGTLPALLEEARRSGQVVHAELDEGLATVPPKLQRTVYRVVQEGLTNARKHAPGVAVDVRVRSAPDGVVLVEITNPVPVGVTASEIPGASAGLTGLAERVGLHSGELTHGIGDGRFRLCARLPAP